MAKLKWGTSGNKKYGTGVKDGVLYVKNGEGEYKPGVAWDGLTAVNESPSGAESTKLYADNTVYGNLISNEEFGATIEAYWTPEEFDACDGLAEMSSGLQLTAQSRKTFGFCYRTEVRNDISDDYGYIIHCVYGCKAQPTEKSHSTINDSPEAETLSYTITTTPVEVEGFKPVAHIKFDSTKLTTAQMTRLKEILYGRDADTEHAITEIIPSLPLPADLNAELAAVAQG